MPTSRIIRRVPTPAEVDPVRAQRRRSRAELALGLAVPIVLLLLWQMAAYFDWINRIIYPAPDKIFVRGIEEFQEGRLRSDFLSTVRNVLLGWVLGVVIGIALGVAMGLSRWVRKALEPVLDALYVVPKVALLPIFINLFGLRDGPKVALVAVTVFFFVWIATMSAVMAVPAGYLETAAVFGASRARRLRDVVWPAILPQIFVSLRVAAGVAVLVIVAAEFLVGSSGLGYLIFNARSLMRNDLMFVGIVVVALFGVIFAEIVRRVGRLVMPWADDADTRDN